MGGRYGGSTDGSSDYQSRQPDDDDLADEQQTVADAVQSVAEQYHDDSERESDGANQHGSSSSDTDSQHPLTAFGGQRSVNSGLDTLADIDEGIADQLAKRVTERVKEAVEETDPDE
jgi:hypothetical protein